MAEIYNPLDFSPYELHTPEEIDEEVKKWQEWKLRQLTHIPHRVPRGTRRSILGPPGYIKKEVKQTTE
jgi:hypothetical protein